MVRHLSTARRDKRIEVRPIFDRQTTNSAIRALDVLSFFDDVRRPSTVGEIARALGIPQSSTSLLLRSLVMAGYLDHDAEDRTFLPSERTALLGHWINPGLVREGAIMELMDRLSEETGNTVFLAMRNGLNAQYIHVVQSAAVQLSHLVPGTVRPLVASCAGYALMQNWTDRSIVAATVRFNAEHGEDFVSPQGVVQSVELVRTNGFSMSRNLHTDGGLAVAVPLTGYTPSAMLALGLGTVNESWDYGARLGLLLKRATGAVK